MIVRIIKHYLVLVWCGDSYRGLQLSLCWHAVQAPAILLCGHHLYSNIHDCLCVLDVFLAGPQVSPCQGVFNHHHPLGHVHHHLQHQQLPTPSSLHQGYRCLVQHVCVFCVPGLAGVCPGQLCCQGRCKVRQTLVDE